MGSLRLGLAALGAVVLLTMFAYYLWLSRRQTRQRVPEPTDDTGERSAVEPTLDVDALSVCLSAPDFDLPIPEKKPSLDALIDALAPIALDAPVSGDAVLAALPPTRRVGSKPFAVEGLNADSNCWQRCAQRHRVFRVCHANPAIL